MNDDRDPLIDACLEEVLGGTKPPDFSEVILREWARRQSSGVSVENPAADLLLPPVCSGPPAAVAIQTQITRASQHEFPPSPLHVRRRMTALISAAIAIALLVAVTIAAWIKSDGKNQAAKKNVNPSTVTTPSSHERSVADRDAKPQKRSNVAPSVRQSPGPEESANDRPSLAKSNVPPAKSETITPAVREPERLTPQDLIAAASRPPPLPTGKVVEQINAAIHKLWAENRKDPPPISDAAWRERTFRTLLGRNPTAADLARIGPTTTAARREQVVDQILNSEFYLEEFARRWSELLTDVFLPVDLVDNSLAHREGMLQYFRRALLEGRALDRVAVDLLTATGSGLPGAADYNGAANYLLARSSGKLEHATADTARLLLGRAVECQQCHDDTRNGGRQAEFWELNAFFRQVAVIRTSDPKVTKLENRDFLGEDKQDGRNAIVFFEQPDGVLKSAFPALGSHREIPRSGLVAEIDRRQWLARCITTSPDFARAMANHLWAAVYGKGILPVDDIGRGNVFSQSLLDELGGQLAAHEFNPRRAIAWAVLSDSFAVPSSDSSLNLVTGATPLFDLFAENSVRSGPPIYESLVAIAKDFKPESANSAATTAKIDDKPQATTKNGQFILDSPLAKPLFDTAPASADPFVRSLLNHPRLSDQQKAEHLFQLVVHRMPRRRELDVVERLLEKAGDRPESAWNSLWSALQASKS